jgi:hypothetical protein
VLVIVLGVEVEIVHEAAAVVFFVKCSALAQA